MSKTFSQLLSTALLFLGVLLFALSAFWGLKHHFSGQPQVEKSQAQQNALAQKIEELRQASQSAPEDIETHLGLADLLLKSAESTPSASIIMEAVNHFHQVLMLEPDNTEALRAMASICLSTGVLDKAALYYPRYLALRPDDLQAKLEYGLVLLSSGEPAKAQALIDEILAASPEMSSARIALAYSYAAQGERSKAREEAGRVRDSAKDKELLKSIDAFLARLGSENQVGAETIEPRVGLSRAERELLSPAREISRYVFSHPVLASKVVAISWPGARTTRIELRDFPVEKMPKEAMQELISQTKAHLRNLLDEFELGFYDVDSGRRLFSIIVGEALSKQSQEHSEG